MIQLRYGNTNTFLIPCRLGYLLVDTDYAGTLPAFYRAIKRYCVRVKDITWVLATHCHPDHIGLVPELTQQGVKLLLVDTQLADVHFSDRIFARDGLPFTAIDEGAATVIRCAESRGFLASIGIDGEIIPTPSHSRDSVSLVLDDGDCIVGDLEPLAYLDGYAEDERLRADWGRIMAHRPKRILYAHANAQALQAGTSPMTEI